jgi:hypothetical protein
LHYKKKSWIQTLALEAKTAISQLQFIDHNHMRNLVAENLKDLIKQNDSQLRKISKNKIAQQERQIMYRIKSKLVENHLTVTKADKGNALVIPYEQNCVSEVEEYIKSNQFEIIFTDITYESQKQIGNNIKAVIQL